MDATIYTDGTYLRNNPQWHASDSAWKARHIAHLLERNAVEPRTVCEIGCGAGEILVNLREHLPEGTRFTGYDISPNAYAICARKMSTCLDYRLGSVLEQDARFDLALAIDVFEHVEDYFGFLRRLRKKATHKVFHIPLELSALMVGRARPLLEARRAVGHLHHFCRDTALATLEDTGYTVVDHFYTSGRTELDGLGWKTQMLKWPRKALYAVDPDAAARLLGGYSLMVLAR